MLGRTHCFLVFLLSIVAARSQPIIFCDLPAPILCAETITCSAPSVQIHIASVQKNLRFEWFDDQQNFLGVLPPAVQKSGFYSVQSTDPKTGCTRTDRIEVKSDQAKPIVEVEVATYAYAGSKNHVLKVQQTTTQPLVFVWKVHGMEEKQIGSEIETYLPGPYELEVINVKNGCSSTQTLDAQRFEDGFLIEK